MIDALGRRRHRTAVRTMIAAIVASVALAVGPAAEQIVARGWRAFVERPAGIGASEPPEERSTLDP